MPAFRSLSAAVAAQAWVLLYLTGPSHTADCEASELLRIVRGMSSPGDEGSGEL